MIFAKRSSRKALYSVGFCIAGLLFAGYSEATSKDGRGDRKKPKVLRIAPRALPAAQRQTVDPEILLLEIYQTLRTGTLVEAEAKAAALVAAYPNFALGQLIRGDLLLMHHNPLSTLGPSQGLASPEVKDLRHEAAVRIAALKERPDPNLMPKSILQLTNDQKFALLVDASRSRMYLYKNTNSRLELVKDYYISQGKLGVNKQKEGDQKTPLGVYHVVTRLATRSLSDFYGSGAMPINYPNDWDRLNDRTGHGIWLHGVPSNTYSRAPRSSNGCVVLTNADMAHLASTVNIGTTPVIISDREEFISKEQWAIERTKALMLLEQWRQDAESTVPRKLRQRYSNAFKAANGESADEWLHKSHVALNGSAKIQVTIGDVQAFDYPGQKNLLVVSFLQTVASGAIKESVRKRQYWSLEAGQWKIVSEFLVEPPKT